ncbi:MAG TPA: hypothetical protein DDX92_07875, partial [Flavobacteriales bacterium]|nr:hypothetical protein [Flavobacteriales bacterium]
TRYDFSNEVLLDPHYLRFKPRTTPYNQLVSHHQCPDRANTR